MNLFFQQEFATVICFDEGYIAIEQYEDSELNNLLGVVRLTEHQFDRLVNNEKSIRKMLIDGDE